MEPWSWWLERWQHVSGLERRAALPIAQLSQLVAAAAQASGAKWKNDEILKVESHLPGFARDGFPSVPPMIENDMRVLMKRGELTQELFDHYQRKRKGN